MESTLTKLVDVYIDGLVGGRPGVLLDRWVRADVRAHGFGPISGVAGVARLLAGLAGYQRRWVQPLRGFDDGDWALLHSFQTFAYPQVERVVFDLVRADDTGRLCEWWSMPAPLAPVSRLGWSQIDGASGCGPDTMCHKSTVAAFCRQVLIRGGRASGFLAPDFIDHDPQPDSDRLVLGVMRNPGLHYHTTLRLVGRGEYVATVSDVEVDREPGLACDLFRVEDGLIAEHWNTIHAGVVTAGEAAMSVPAPERRIALLRRNNRFTGRPLARPAPAAPAGSGDDTGTRRPGSSMSRMTRPVADR